LDGGWRLAVDQLVRMNSRSLSVRSKMVCDVKDGRRIKLVEKFRAVWNVSAPELNISEKSNAAAVKPQSYSGRADAIIRGVQVTMVPSLASTYA
jgi:hypothetical protein